MHWSIAEFCSGHPRRFLGEGWNSGFPRRRGRFQESVPPSVNRRPGAAGRVESAVEIFESNPLNRMPNRMGSMAARKFEAGFASAGSESQLTVVIVISTVFPILPIGSRECRRLDSQWNAEKKR